MMTPVLRPRLAVWKFASCDGCQLALLDCEDELLAIADQIDIAYFAEASRARMAPPYDLSLVEGLVSTPADVERIHEVRRRSKCLATIGACATAGGIQALRNFDSLDTYARIVYPRPEHIAALATSSPIADHVAVDFELRGCPINKRQLVEVINAFLNGRRPVVPTHSVCMECKMHGTVCVMVSHGTACLGPVTQDGCGALCPLCGRGCYGCFGPTESPNMGAMTDWLRRLGMDPREIRWLLRTFNADAPSFRDESERHRA
jgi:coenzyme F420-reducing hydrogenase gamma subunit